MDNTSCSQSEEIQFTVQGTDYKLRNYSNTLFVEYEGTARHQSYTDDTCFRTNPGDTQGTKRVRFAALKRTFWRHFSHWRHRMLSFDNFRCIQLQKCCQKDNVSVLAGLFELTQFTLQWRHMSVMFDNLFRITTKKTSKLRIASPFWGEFTAQRASNAKKSMPCVNTYISFKLDEQ